MNITVEKQTLCITAEKTYKPNNRTDIRLTIGGQSIVIGKDELQRAMMELDDFAYERTGRGSLDITLSCEPSPPAKSKATTCSGCKV